MQPLIPYFPTIQFTVPMPSFMPMEHLVIYAFGLCVGIGVIYGAQITRNRGARIGLDDKVMRELFIWTVLGVIVGGHLGYGLFYHPQEYFANPILFLKINEGLSSFGGFIFCVIAFYFVLKRHKQPIWPYADSIVIGFSFGWFFGRLGCTINHEHPGTPSQFFLARYCRPVEGWTIELPDWMTAPASDLRFNNCLLSGNPVTTFSDKVTLPYSGVIAEHDTGLYECLYALVLFLTCLWLDRKPRFPGFFAMLLVFTYAPLRFLMDFTRPEVDNARYMGLTPAQWGCTAFLAAAIWGFGYLRRQNRVVP